MKTSTEKPPKTVKTPPTKEEPVDTATGARPLEPAREAFEGGDFAKALNLVNAVINSQNVEPQLEGRAHTLRAKIYCKQGRTEKARTELNWLDAHEMPKLAAQVRKQLRSLVL